VIAMRVLQTRNGAATFAWDDDITIEVRHPTVDRYSRLWCEVLARHGHTLVNHARIDLLNQRQRIDYHAVAHAHDGTIDWHRLLLDIIPPLQEGMAATEASPAPGTSAPTQPPEPFPVEVLPGPCRRLVEEGAKALPCAPDLIAVPMLPVLGVAIGARRTIQVKTSWRERARAYVSVIADSGQKKSPALALAMKPIHAIQHLYKRRYDEAHRAYEAALNAYEGVLDDWRKARRGTRGPRPPKPEEPVMGEIYTSDCTVEAMADILEQHPRGVLFIRDELTGWVLALNQYKGGKGADRQHWLQWWNGTPDKINRRGRKVPLVIADPFVCVAGCLTPDDLPLLLDERIQGEDGFLPRILFAFPDPVPTPWTDAVVSPDTETAYANVVHRLLALNDDKTLTCTPKAHALLVKLINELATVRQDPATPPPLVPFLAKLDGYLARLALTLQMGRWAAGESGRESVEELSVAGAAALIHYFRVHAARVYARLQASPEDRQVELALAWIRAHGGTATVRELVRSNVAGLKAASEAKALLLKLEDRGWGSVSEGDRHRVSFTLRE
jgi:Protein of unknown function (DUF3987)